MSKVTIIVSALKKYSSSNQLVERLVEILEGIGHEPNLVNLRDLDLPFCTGESQQFEKKDLNELEEKLGIHRYVIFVTPIYNYDVNSALKNFIEVAGFALQDKVVGLVSTAASGVSFLAPLNFLNSLMVTFNCWIVPRFAMATKDDFIKENEISEALVTRLNRLVNEMLRCSLDSQAAEN